MPKIQTRGRQSVGEVNFSTGDASGAVNKVAQSNAQGLQTLGQGLQRFGQGLDTFEKKRTSLEKNRYNGLAQAAATRAAQHAEAFAPQSEERAADGKNLLAIGDQMYKEKQDAFLETVPKEHRAGIMGYWEKGRADYSGKLITQSAADFVAAEGKDGQAIEDSYRDMIRVNPSPEALVTSIEALKTYRDGQVKGGVMGQFQMDKMQENTKKSFAGEAIESLIQQGKFDTARRRVMKGDLSKIYSGDEETKKLQRIMTAEQSYLSLKNQKENARIATENRIHKEQGEALYSGLAAALSVDPVEGVDEDGNDIIRSIDQREDALRAVDNPASIKVMTRQQRASLHAIGRKSIGSNNDIIEYEIMSEIISGDRTLDQIEARIHEELGDKGTIDHTTGSKLLGLIRGEKRSRRTRGIRARTEEDKAAKGFLQAAYNSPEHWERIGNRPELALASADAYYDYYELKVLNPGVSKKLLALKVIKDDGKIPGLLGRKMPGIDPSLQNDDAGIMKAIKLVDQIYRKGKNTPEALRKRDNTIKELRKRLGFLQIFEEIENNKHLLDKINTPKRGAK